MTCDQWLQQNYLQEIFSGQFEHLRGIVEALDLVPLGRIITIAGTNGKGQTVRSLEYLLRTRDSSTAQLTSPHLISARERFVFSGEMVGDEELLEAFKTVQALLPRRVSYFEFLFFVFLYLVKQKQPQFVLLEVGLGGRLDATNSIDADLMAITSISRDHQDLLGKTYREILFEKAGILRKDRKVITSFQLDYLNRIMDKITRQKDAIWEPLQAEGLNFSESNQKLAKKLAQELTGEVFDGEIPNLAIRKKLELNDWLLHFYPSHNPEGIRKLFHFLKSTKYNNYEYLVLSFSERQWSDLELMMAVILEHFAVEKVFYCLDQHPKYLSKQDVLKLKDKFGFQIFERDKFFEKNNLGPILVTGSNYFLGSIYLQLAGGEHSST